MWFYHLCVNLHIAVCMCLAFDMCLTFKNNESDIFAVNIVFDVAHCHVINTLILKMRSWLVIVKMFLRALNAMVTALVML